MSLPPFLNTVYRNCHGDRAHGLSPLNPREARVPAELQGRLVLWKHPHINNGCSCCYMGPILGDMLTFYYPDESPSKMFRVHDPNHSSEGEMGPNALYREYWRKNGE